MQKHRLISTRNEFGQTIRKVTVALCLIVRIKKWLLRGCRMIKCNDALYLMARCCT